MSTDTKDITIYLCKKHLNVNLKKYWPEHTFNGYFRFPGKTCTVTNCENEAFHQYTGIIFPDTIPADVQSKYNTQAAYEIFTEAKEIMDKGLALEVLTLYLKSRIIPREERKHSAGRVIRHHAKMILEKLNLLPLQVLSDEEKHKILLELGMYPEDWV